MKKIFLIFCYLIIFLSLNPQNFSSKDIILVSRNDSMFNTINKALKFFEEKNDSIASILVLGTLDFDSVKIPEKIKIVNIKGMLAYNIGANNLNKSIFIIDKPDKILLFDHLDNFSIYGKRKYTLFAAMCYINDLISDTPETTFVELQNSEISGKLSIKNWDRRSILFAMNLLNTERFSYPSNIITGYTLLPYINYISTSFFSNFYNNYNETTRGFFFVDKIKKDSTRIYGGSIETERIKVGSGPQVTKFFKIGSFGGIIFDEKDTFYFIKDTLQIKK
ncbi:MAG: hypothetical protein ABIM64_05305 [candidate division WOR-3 bacterium]